MFLPRVALVLSLVSALFTSCVAPTSGNGMGKWQPLSLSGASGIAPAGSRWIAVGDAKKANEPRAILIERGGNGSAHSRFLRWIGPLPVDLEAVSAVPGTSYRFVAVTSKGEWFSVKLDDSSLRVTEHGRLPGSNLIRELEGFSISNVGDRQFAVWGNRGSHSEPGRLFWSEWNRRSQRPIGSVQSTEIRMPWPHKNVRHISDLHLSPDGHLFVSSASDPGDRGPFLSAVWKAGRFENDRTGLIWKPFVSPHRMLREGPNGHKIEAISFDAFGQLVVASDDEALGSAIRF